MEETMDDIDGEDYRGVFYTVTKKGELGRWEKGLDALQNHYCSETKIAAIPIPLPIHILVMNTFPPVCLAIFIPVAT